MMAIQQNKIAILIGAGAVQNAWGPVLSCFRLINGAETDSYTANFLFAKSICALRLYSKSLKGMAQLNEERDMVNAMKEIVGLSLKNAQQNGTLKPREEFESILNNLLF
ncbi:hypothetical protein [Sphingobacterium arenae]|uniref:Uncharacterized protein n=1 Tax=Sphingobacterium arenae TaxID=1280598 RepID=A0ABR7Y9E8_9SPHI|nr:hypothetical protein [Sphingobacterium arenae]MBD1427902.1 hypothetical protein [Sphingobacterium arenae]